MTAVVEPQIHLWTCEEYYKVAETGIFDGNHVELIEGVIIEMSPMSSRHSAVVALVQATLATAFGPAFYVRTQSPLDLGALSEPEPDVAVIAGSIRDYLDHHPTHALLIVEIADTSLAYDRGKKAHLYARAGIQDYWIVNLKESILEVYRQPEANDGHPSGFGYASTSRFAAQDTIRPLARPDGLITVGELLP